MKRRMFAVLTAVALVALLVPQTALSAGAPERVIVRFEGGAADPLALAAIRMAGGVKIKELPLIGGAAFALPGPAAARAVARMRRVRSVEPDIQVTALGKPTRPAPTQPAEVVQWGVMRIHADDVWPFDTGDAIKVAVVDTGIELTHPDLASNVAGGMSAVGYTSSWNDDNGHGTHVAGIVAAVDNTIGVVGTAPAAHLYSVKVLNRKGSGWVSDIVEGLQWCVDNDIDVVNMSLGSKSSSASFADAVQATLDAGVVVVAAAGNSGPGAVEYPGAYPGVIAVGATDSSNNIASWSSRGPEVAVAAPGVSVKSTYKGLTYATMSGTSMAAPHVAGVAALVMATPNVGGWTPAEVRARLTDTASDLGATGFDTSFGYGLVRADLAVAP